MPSPPDPRSPEPETSFIDHLEPGEELHEHLRAFARALVADPSKADDIAQEAWVAALSQPPGRVRAMSAWMRGVMRNIARRDGLRERRRREIEDAAARSLLDDDFEARLVDNASTHRTLRSLTEALPAAQRAVITLLYFEGLPLEQVARVLDRPLETVRTQRRRGLESLRAELDRRHAGDRARWIASLVPWIRGEPNQHVGAPRGIALRAAGVIAAVALGVAVFVWTRDASPPSIAEAPGGNGDTREAIVALDSVGEGGARVTALDPEPIAPPTATPNERRLTIRVVTPAGEPAPNAVVAYSTSGVKRVSVPTDPLGVAVIVVPTSQLSTEIFFSAENPGIEVSAVSGDAAESHAYFVTLPAEGRTFELPLGGPGEHLVLRVVDPDGRPIQGARILIDFDGVVAQTIDAGTVRTQVHRNPITTDAKGVASYANLEQKVHQIAVSAPGFVMACFALPGSPTPETRDVEIRPGGEIVGTVRGPDGYAWAGARVQLFGDPRLVEIEPHAISDEQGAFRLGGVADGRHWLLASDPQHEQLTDDAIVAAAAGTSTTCELQLAERPKVVVHVRGRSDFQGVVVLKATGGAPWWATGGSTDDSGRAQFAGVPRCALKVEVFDALTQTLVAHTQVGSERDAQIEMVLPSESANDMATLSGTIVDEMGRPFESSTLVLAIPAERGLAEVNAVVDPKTGRFDRLFAPPGPRRLFAILGDGVHDVGQVELAAGEQLDLGTLRVPPTGTLLIERGTSQATGHDWEVESRLRFEAFELTRRIATLSATRDELALRPGRYRLRALKPNADDEAAIEFEVRAGETVRVRAP
jgi:RNA polymerase sigma-70 factor (ECF subfamily)